MISYFAYGSNMDPARLRHRGVFIIGMRPACLFGYKLVFNKTSADKQFGFANIVKEKLSRVEGILFEIDEDELSKLDIYEGFPQHYIRKVIEVSIYGGWTEKAVVYIASPGQTEEGLRPSPEYLEHLLSAKKYLSKPYYRELLKII